MSMEELMQQADPELYAWETTDVKPVDDARKEGGIIYAAGIEKQEVPGKLRWAKRVIHYSEVVNHN